MYKIGDFSQIAQVSVRMLRHYDKLDLLKPEHVDNWTGYRYYTLPQLSHLHRILALRDLGLTLEQIGDVLEHAQADALLYEMLQTKQQTIVEQLAAEQAKLERVAARLKQIEQVEEPIAFDVVLKSLPAQQIAALRETVPHLSQMGDVRDRLFRTLYRLLKTAEIPPGNEIVIYHLQAYSEENIDMSLAVEVAQTTATLTPDSPLQFYTLAPAPQAASIIFNGGMWQIQEVVVNLYRWLGMNGYASAGDYREHHLFGRELDLCATDPPGEGVFEILVPIEKL